MGMFIGVLVFVFSASYADVSSDLSKTKVIKLRDSKAIEAEYCRVETGAHFDHCGMPYGTEKLEVLYASDKIGKLVEAHVRDSYAKKYHYNLDKKDLFHGHFMAKGPQALYDSAEAYFADIQVSLYHSKEYLQTWENIPLEDDPFLAVRPDQRSFVGMFFNNSENVTAAIDLISRDIYPQPYPIKFLRGYKTAGTIYTIDINESQHYSDHEYQSFGGQTDLYVNLCEPNEPNCEPCRIFAMAYILEDSNGRYTSPDGKRFDVTVHCRYYKK